MTNKNHIQKKREFSDNLMYILIRATFFIFSFWFLGVYNDEFLYKLQAYSLFLYNPAFVGDVLNQSAGVLVYLSRFLTQFLYYPLLGALLLSLGLSGIEWWISRLFKIPSRYFFLSFVPPALILLTQTSIGYALYYKFETSVVFSLVLGSLVVLLLFSFYRRIKKFSWGIWISLLTCFAFFFVTGVYAFIALIMLLTERILNREKYALWLTAGGLLLVALLPFVLGKYIFHETYMAVLFSPLPVYKGVFVFSLLSLLFFSLYPLFFKNIKGVKDFKENAVSIKVIGGSFLLFCLSLFAVFYFSFRDDNFRLELRLQRLTEKYKWDLIIKEAEKAQEPTKTIAAYRAIALANTNQLSQRFFDFNYRYKPPASSGNDDVVQKLSYFSDFYLYASLPNIAYLWNMEFWVGSGANFYLLKKMAICAMLNGEKELASKYLTLLKESLFYKSWAEKQEKYNNDPDILIKNPVYKQIKQYMPEEDFVLPIKYPLPVCYKFLWENFRANLERPLIACLYTKDLDQFMRIIYAINMGRELPACMQEAVIMYAIINNHFAVLERFRINGELREKVIAFMTELKRYGDNRKLAEEKLKKYKGRYCYFYAFSNTK